MAKATVSIEIAKPTSQVFGYMSDLNNMTKWTNMEGMNLDGPLATGTTGAFDMPMMGRNRVFPFVITEYLADRRWAIKITNRLQVLFDYSFLPTPRGTRITQIIDVRPNGLLRLAAPLIAMMMRGEEMGELRRLKTALESAAIVTPTLAAGGSAIGKRRSDWANNETTASVANLR
jgi:Polyketide cyclase / dehydrase and lipid transport